MYHESYQILITDSNVVVSYSWFVIGQCCNFQGINSTVEISWDIFRILADYRLRHLINNLAIHIYTHDYIRMEITVLYLKISRHQLSISWSQISVYWLYYRIASRLNLRPLNLQLMPWNSQIQHVDKSDSFSAIFPIYFIQNHLFS